MTNQNAETWCEALALCSGRIARLKRSHYKIIKEEVAITREHGNKLRGYLFGGITRASPVRAVLPLLLIHTVSRRSLFFS